MTNILEETAPPVTATEEEAEEEDEDANEDGDDVQVVEETQREDLDPVLKARKKSRLGVV